MNTETKLTGNLTGSSDETTCYCKEIASISSQLSWSYLKVVVFTKIFEGSSSFP